MKRHGHDTMTASMTAHDTISVMAQPVDNQNETKHHDTMTLNYSKWGDKGKYGLGQCSETRRTPTECRNGRQAGFGGIKRHSVMESLNLVLAYLLALRDFNLFSYQVGL